MDYRNRNLLLGLGIFALLAFLAFSGGMMMPHPSGFVGPGPIGPNAVDGRQFVGGAPFFFGGIGLLFRLAFFALIVFFAVRLFRRGSFGRRDFDESTEHELSATEILRRRYAAGEITREQYEEMRQTLHSTT